MATRTDPQTKRELITAFLGGAIVNLGARFERPFAVSITIVIPTSRPWTIARSGPASAPRVGRPAPLRRSCPGSSQPGRTPHRWLGPWLGRHGETVVRSPLLA